MFCLYWYFKQYQNKSTSWLCPIMFLHRSIQPQCQIRILCLAWNGWHVLYTHTPKKKKVFLLFPGRGRTKTQPLFPLWSSKEKEGMRAQTYVSKVWQQRGEARWEGRWDEKTGERRGAGGDKCLDSAFKDNSHNGRHPQYTEAVKRMRLYCVVSHYYVFKCISLYLGFTTRLLFKIHSTAQLHLPKWSYS